MKLVLLLGLLGGAMGQGVDETLVPGTSGHAVVEATLDTIENTCIFKNDRLFFRRLAYVESNAGTSPTTYRPGNNGGIWQVNEQMLRVTQNSAANTFLRNHTAQIARDLKVDWNTVTWTDLRKPLYSALAARLYIAYRTRAVSGGIPVSMPAQAAFWKTYYNPSRSGRDFTTLGRRLSTSCKSGRGIDLSFVLDGSGSITSANFDKIKSFVEKVVNAFNIGRNKTRISVIQYSDLSHVEFKFNQHFTRRDVINAVKRIRYRGGGTRTYLALDQLRTTLYQVSNGARPKDKSHPRVAVVLTDGQSNVALVSAAAKKVHAQDITVLAIGVGNINMQELNAIASAPVCMHLSLLEDFTEIDSLKYTIQKSSCEAPTVIGPGKLKEMIKAKVLQNCKLKLPVNGVTVKLLASSGSATFYEARSRYPNAAFYDQKIQSNGFRSAIYIQTNQSGETYCSIEGGNSTVNNVTLDVESGDKEWCRSRPCQNGGQCVDEGDRGYRCICQTGYHGNNCQEAPTRCRSNPCSNGCTCNEDVANGYTCTCPPGIGGSVHRYTCRNNSNPCTNKNIKKTLLYHAHVIPTKFIQCSLQGRCQVYKCPAGLQWKPSAKTCSKPCGARN